MGGYKDRIQQLAADTPLFKELVVEFPSLFTRFEALYRTVNSARNDAMHTGAYARHATDAAIELCIGLEDALMSVEVGALSPISW